MALFALIFFVVAMILIGVGIAVGVVACCVAAVLVVLGVFSSSVIVGLITRRPVAGVRTFLLECALLAGIPSGILCAWLVHYTIAAAGPGWLISIYGAIGGAVAGLVIALLLDFTFRRLHRWGTTAGWVDTP
ncbi:MAG: hypothetical protein DLM52_12525 [Chthoniobacterales bacterium]|nr:MAG: hypothetical protein DLM52_12525 [Chthoniobacterales bacterium]